ncbi:hypothetical protein ABB37_05717 [Leptomonas pyrrhocoris]|uniref:Uncharacterized protein n=1 Tax=Leptomonas pyrrhocoris TaxID=157538 RepID=A0A0M9FZF0_LEPPY|nr:hypothetical protein ABB37_05717 [Leptomonas pyrrhocoris]XP_015657675.1 hypothetical protein ABB37_05717 [Leptomonas pyrrhocoris]KPA79235.1 hypothetical protein ABB37_05717 [Leptomonas pyrrhocoris]KPA79236.1 hypothetical protein ABB37_05717 [Leptomonas pyrrhocoris]|eukprot:XP_015657674.1 hypothetical protein ABB37_05717 [Leptomonas pyrrhocoris]
MTTMALVDETLARFERKSPRDSYKQVCEELGVHMQRDVYAALPVKQNAWHHLHSLELEKSLLGTKGCMALLPIITVSTSMRKLNLRSCGVSDEFVAELCLILQNHPSLRYVDISDNELVTVYSAPHIISVMRGNPNMVLFDVYNTHVGANVAGIIEKLGEHNLESVLHYYEDRYFRMKNLFNYMDADGTGWVLLKSLVLNCPYPVVQEQFIERIAKRKPIKRSDNTIHINTFMHLVYMNYKTETEIGRMAQKTLDEPYIFIVANWKQLLRAVKRHNVGEKGNQHVELPADFHRWRLRDYMISNEDADAVIEAAVQLVEHSATATTPDKADEGEIISGKTHLCIPIQRLLQAAKATLVPPPSAVKPAYHFYQDHDVTYIPMILRDGSRTFSVGGMSALFGASASSADGDSAASAADSVDPADPPHTFSLPASLVKMIVELFNKEFARLPKKRVSVLPETPRRRRDRAMEKSAVPVRAFLSAEFVTPLERVCPRLLADYYARHAILIDEGTITLQEMVNVLDEMYVQCRIDRVFSLEDVQAMPDPMDHGPTAHFLEAHLKEREDGVPNVELLGGASEL